jgi:hypothetical protein
MKERIKELMAQAGTDTSGKWMGVDHAEKFAELIIKECAEIVEHSRIEGDEGACLVGATKCKIKQHFGVA